MKQVLYKALKHFDSALVGGKIPEDLFYFGEDAAKPLIEAGLIEKVEPLETKPKLQAKKETKPAPKAKKATK